MKSLKLFFYAMLLWFITIGTASAQTQTVYKYEVVVPTEFCTKEVFSDVFDDLSTMDRHITDRFTFKTTIPYTTDMIRVLLINSDVEVISVERTKNSEPVYAIEKAGGTDCEQAMQLCNNSSVPGNSNGFGTQELNNTNRGCLALNEHQSSWYYINVSAGGVLNFRINPINGNNDYDFALWGPFTATTAAANCPPITAPVRCNWSSDIGNSNNPNGNTGLSPAGNNDSEGASGIRWSNPINVSAGQVYILLVDNFSTSGTGYSIEFSWGNGSNAVNTTATIGCIPVNLPIELVSFEGIFDEPANSNDLTWVTESERNNDYFIIERSVHPADGTIVWNEIVRIDGAGNSVNTLVYSFQDYNYTRDAINYYRISQTDYDGTKEVFDDKLIAIDNRDKNKKIVVKTINLLGQEVKPDTPGVVIYIFEDNTIKRVVNP